MSDDRIKSKLVTSAYTIDEAIKALQKLKRAGAPGDQVLGASAEMSRKVLAARQSAEAEKAKRELENKTYGNRSPAANDRAERDVRLAKDYKTTFWVEYFVDDEDENQEF